MNPLLITLLIIFSILFLIVIIIFFKVKRKLGELSEVAFGTKDFIKGIKDQELDALSEAKTITGMEKLDLPRLGKDFKDLNINELKRESEKKIVKCLDSIEKKEIKNIKEEVLKVWINTRIEDLKNDNVSYDQIKFHNTILNRYEKNDAIATIKIHTALEYNYSKNNKSPQKVQTRFELEYIYIIDEDKISSHTKGIGLNCPNCGAPIKNLGSKSCDYCGSGVVDIVKRTWVLNNIKEF